MLLVVVANLPVYIRACRARVHLCSKHAGFVVFALCCLFFVQKVSQTDSVDSSVGDYVKAVPNRDVERESV